MATKKTIWTADGVPGKTFATEAEAIHAERVHTVARNLCRHLAPGLMAKDCELIAEWILTHFVPKSSTGPQTPSPSYAAPQVPSAVPPRAPGSDVPGPVRPSMETPPTWGHETPEDIKRPFRHNDAIDPNE